MTTTIYMRQIKIHQQASGATSLLQIADEKYSIINTAKTVETRSAAEKAVSQVIQDTKKKDKVGGSKGLGNGRLETGRAEEAGSTGCSEKSDEH